MHHNRTKFGTVVIIFSGVLLAYVPPGVVTLPFSDSADIFTLETSILAFCHSWLDQRVLALGLIFSLLLFYLVTSMCISNLERMDTYEQE